MKSVLSRITKIVIFCILLYFGLFASLIIPYKVSAQTLPFSDDFESGSSQWTPVTGTWSIQNVNGSNRYGTTVIPTFSCCSESVGGNVAWNNYSYELDLLGKQGVDKNLIFRYIDPSTKYGLHLVGSGIFLEKHTPGSDIDISSAYGNFTNNNIYHIKIDLLGNNIKVYVDSTLYINYTDSTSPILNGKIGLRVGTGAAAPSEVWYDNVLVTELSSATPTPTPTSTPTPTPSPSPSPTPIPTAIPTATPIPTPIPLPSLNVPDIKQFWPPWNDDIYDQATKWSSNPTIERWGCALTSAVMVLKYHGHTYTNPDILNFWLINQPDGYLANGLLNWLAVSRYTKINQSLLSPTLEYRRLEANSSLLINELENNRPAILKEPGHFVVAKSQLPTTFGINDPGYSDRTTLVPYGDTFQALGSYWPTSTDLSYILLTIDPDFEIEVFDSLGTKIEGFTFVDEPIADIWGSPATTAPLKIFQFPAPPDDLYTVKITGEGTYNLNTYLYDQEGQVETASFKGLASEGQTDQLSILVDEDPQSITPQITIDSIINDLDGSYKLGLITKKGIYLSLKNQLRTVKRFLELNMTRIAKRRLLAVEKQIKKYTPKFIKPTASEVLLFDIKTLIDSL